jgi:membrane protein
MTANVTIPASPPMRQAGRVRWFTAGKDALGVAKQVQRRYVEIGAAALASAITLSAFLSMIPLLVVGIAVLGFVASGQPDLGSSLVDRLGLTGAAADLIQDAVSQAADSRRAASVIGLVSLAVTGLGLAKALQEAHCRVWQVERKGVRALLGAVGWVGIVGVVFVAGFALTAVLQLLPAPLRPLGALVSYLVAIGVFLSTKVLIPNRAVGWRDLLLGALVGAVLLELLKYLGAIYVPMAIASTSGVYGPIGVVIALLGWLLIFGRLILYVTVLQVVRWEAAHGTALRRVGVPMPVGAGVELTRGGLVATPKKEGRGIRLPALPGRAGGARRGEAATAD